MMWVTVTFKHMVDDVAEEASWTILAHSWEEAQDKMHEFGRDLDGLTIMNFSTQTIKFT
tara:strand:- start:194 stop:370 length:177 start_codon:yes stop_codon:yes gene_type:complete